MKIVSTVEQVREEVKKWRQQGLTVGLVPTMGYLHEGHKSLIDKAVAQNDKVVVSVFVNPIQFGPTEDLATYPRDLERDAALCEDAGAALIFHPEKEDMYFDDFCTYIDMDGLTKGLCGKTRPIHFRGVCTVVGKLFNIVHPDRAYFGQKDAQQLAVVRRMDYPGGRRTGKKFQKYLSVRGREKGSCDSSQRPGKGRGNGKCR